MSAAYPTARVVRTGSRWKRTCCTAGTSLAAYRCVTPRQATRGQTPAHPTLLPASPAARTISALLTLRDHVIAPLLADVKIRRHDHIPARLTPIDQDYEHLRTDMATLFRHVGIQPGPAAA